MKVSKMALGELFNVGSSKRVLKSQWTTEGVPFYRGREITHLASDGYVDNELFISEDLYSDYANKYGVPKSGDIVITAIGTIGNSYIVREGDKFYFKDASVLWLNKKANISSEFINFWFKSPLFTDQLEVGNGATVDTLTINKLQSVTIDLPPLPEQKRIVGILDEAFDGIATAKANAEKNLQNARALFESHLQSVFTQRGKSVRAGWHKTKLADLAKVQSGSGFPTKFQGKVKRGIPFYKVSDMNIDGNERDMIHENNSISEQVRKELGAVLFPRGSVIFPKIGGAIATNKKRLITRDCCVDNNVMGVIPKPGKISSEFLYYFFLGHNLSDFANEAHLPSIKKTVVEDWELCVPISLPEQERIVAQLDSFTEETQHLESNYQHKLAALDTLKKSLLHQAFTGNLQEHQ